MVLSFGRADPNYNSFGEWYGWVMLDFTLADEIHIIKSMVKMEL